MLTLLFMSAQVSAQETVIFYPDLYDGFSIENVENEPAVVNDLWAGSENDVPNDILGYTKEDGYRALRVSGYNSNYYITDSYLVMNPVDLSVYDQSKEFKFTFCLNAQYHKNKNGNNGTTFTVLLATNYTGKAETTDWTDVTDQLDQIDDHVSYDGKWSKSTLNLNDYKAETDLVLAFRYKVANNGTVDTSTDRPGRWRLAEIRFTTGDFTTAIGDELKADEVMFQPNPAKDYIQLISNDFSSVEFYGVNGELLLTVNSPQDRVDISSLPAGLYILKLKQNSGNIETRKLVKQ